MYDFLHDKFMNQLKAAVRLIIKLRFGIITIISLLMLLSAYSTFNNLRIDNSLSIWFLEDDPSYKAYIDFQKNYGSDEIFIAMFPVSDAVGESEMSVLNDLHQRIDTLPFVNTSYSLARAQYPILINKHIRLDNLYNKSRSNRGLRALFSKLPNITSQLVTEDFKNQFFYIQLNPTPSIEEERRNIANDIRKAIESHYSKYYLTGPPVLNEAYSKGIYKESLTFGVLTVLIMTIMLLFLLPDKRYLFMALLAVAVPVSLLFGLMTSMGAALNMISMLIPTILMVYSVSDAVHIINIYHKEGLLQKSLSKIDLLSLSIRKSLTPCFYTTLTTFVGYFALYLSPLPAFKNMGVFTCIGLVLSFVLVYIIVIIGFSFMVVKFDKKPSSVTHSNINQSVIITWLNDVTERYSTQIIVFFTGLLVAGIFAVFQVEIDTHSLDLLAEGKEKQELRHIESKLRGSSRLQLNITTEDQSSILSSKTFKKLQNFQNKLDENIFINAPVSIVNIKNFLEKRSPVLFQSNVSSQKIKETFDSFELNNSFFKLFSEDFSTASFTLSLPEMTTSELDQVITDIKRDFKASFNTNKYALNINGFAVVFAQLNNFILETQFKSFVAAFFVAFLCLWVFIKNFRTTCLVLIPNVLPLSILAILMTLLDIPLGVTTAMITPIMLGIAMDDTIHLVYQYKKHGTIKSSPKSRVNLAVKYTGNALFSTTIALVAGFLIIASSAVPSVRDFGLLCAVSVAAALITDLIYLPALLKTFDR